jgi:adenosine deaminase
MIELNADGKLRFVKTVTTPVDWVAFREKVAKMDWEEGATVFYRIIKTDIFFPYYHQLIINELDIQKIKAIEFRIRFGSIRDVSIEQELKMFYDIRKSLWKHTSHDFAIIAQACKTHRFEYLKDYFGELNTLYRRHAWVREILHGFDLACNEDVGRPLRSFHSIIKHIQIPPFFHAGESGPIDKILDNIKYCIEIGCKRIGHGIYVAKDPVLLERLKRAEICLELCPWSNIYLNVTKTKKELIDLYNIIFASGIKYCINTDDPNKMNDKTLEDNYKWCEINTTGFNRAFADLNSIKYATTH